MLTNRTFEVEYSRTVNLGAFNSLKLTVRESFDDNIYAKTEAMKIVRSFVLKELQNELDQIDAENQLGGKTEKMIPLKQNFVKVEPISTKWRPTRNKTIEWCPENEADPEDVKTALAKENKNLWFLESEKGLSIFRRAHP